MMLFCEGEKTFLLPVLFVLSDIMGALLLLLAVPSEVYEF